jgi:hypothetical protein
MADEDDKVRRNLVVVSRVILATAFLELPVSGVIDLFASAPEPFKAIPQSKFWAIGLTLLAYLLSRYRFSADGKDMVQVVKNTRDREQAILEVREVRRAEQEFNLNGTLRPSIGQLRAPIELLHKEAELEGRAGQRLKLQFNEPWNSLNNLSRIPFHFLSGPDNAGHSALEPRPTFSTTFTLQQKIYFKCRAMLIGYAYSEGAIQKLAPVIFASLAVITLWFRIAYRVAEHWAY